MTHADNGKAFRAHDRLRHLNLLQYFFSHRGPVRNARRKAWARGFIPSRKAHPSAENADRALIEVRFIERMNDLPYARGHLTRPDIRAVRRVEPVDERHALVMGDQGQL